MNTSFDNPKSLRFVITLGTGSFGSSSNNQITLVGYRAKAKIDKAGGMQMSQLRAEIYGVRQSDMNSITTLQWNPLSSIKNTVQVYAIDGDQTTLVFQGVIVNAWGNYQSMPNVFLNIQAQAAYFGQITPTSPISFKGQVDLAVIMNQIAGNLGLTFENNGVSIQINNPYLADTSVEQAKKLARAYPINLYIDDTVLAITPQNQPRNLAQVPLISPQSGLKGYPTFDGVGVNFDTFFNPSIIFGGPFQLQTSIPQAAGQWITTAVGHNLESETQDGPWFSTIRGTKTGLAITTA